MYYTYHGGQHVLTFKSYRKCLYYLIRHMKALHNLPAWDVSAVIRINTEELHANASFLFVETRTYLSQEWTVYHLSARFLFPQDTI